MKSLRPLLQTLLLMGSYVALLPPLEAEVATRPLIAAHRGTTSGAPENTLAAIRWASDFGADLIETDLRVTADGEFVLMHDEHVSRTTNGLGRVHELTLRELRALDAGGGERIPTLDEAMQLLSDRPQRLLLDVKAADGSIAPRLVDAVAAHGFEQRVLVGVRSIELLQRLRSIDPQVKILALAPKVADVHEFLSYQPDGVRLWARWAQSDPGLARSVRERGSEVWIMSGERRPTELRDLLPLADGFITDLPVEFRKFADREPVQIPQRAQ